jgi:hypothetical protein
MTEDGKPFCCKLYGPKIELTGDAAEAWIAYHRLLGLSVPLGMGGGYSVNFDLVKEFDLDVQNWDFFWKVIEIIHIKVLDSVLSKGRKK